MAVRDYFGDYAVSADREVQVYRRQLAESLGGAPGSEVDLLFRRPAAGPHARDAIAIPIEVKLAHNPEARTGLAEQLVARYMSQLGTSGGVYVVVWMGPRGTAGAARPLWSSPEKARADLLRQAAELTAACDGMRLGIVVIDASLPRRAKPSSKARDRSTAAAGKKRTGTGKPVSKTATKKTSKRGGTGGTGGKNKRAKGKANKVAPARRKAAKKAKRRPQGR